MIVLLRITNTFSSVKIDSICCRHLSKLILEILLVTSLICTSCSFRVEIGGIIFKIDFKNTRFIYAIMGDSCQKIILLIVFKIIFTEMVIRSIRKFSLTDLQGFVVQVEDVFEVIFSLESEYDLKNGPSRQDFEIFEENICENK